MVSVGAVLFLDGLLIYMFHQGNNNTVTLTCSDAQNTNEANIIHGEQNYVIIEFAGALAAVAFYVRLRVLCCHVCCMPNSNACYYSEMSEARV